MSHRRRALGSAACAGAVVSAFVALANGCGRNQAGPTDASAPASDAADAAIVDGSVDVVDAAIAIAEGGPACAPVTRAFTTGFPVPIPRRLACDTALIHPILDCLYTPPYDPGACDALVAPTGPQADCLDCLFAAPDAAAPGPIIVQGGSAEVNGAGCVAAVLPSNGGCAQGLFDVAACTRAACSDCVARGANVFAECRTAAIAGPCAAIADEASGCARVLGPDGGAERCDPPGTFLQAATRIAGDFCGGYVDAGSSD